ncbi:hypothetical protein HK405_002742, partial [Cladochytrium tenue]
YLALRHHPVPEIPCPCFEDSIAFTSVVCGVVVGCWLHSRVVTGTIAAAAAIPLPGILAAAAAATATTTLDPLAPQSATLPPPTPAILELLPLLPPLPVAARLLLRLAAGVAAVYAYRAIVRAALRRPGADALVPAPVARAVSLPAAPRLGPAKVLSDGVTYFGIAVLACHFLPLAFRLV